MCAICVEWEKGKLTSKEAYRNLGEALSATEDETVKSHLMDLSEKILEKELETKKVDDEIDHRWWQENHE